MHKYKGSCVPKLSINTIVQHDDQVSVNISADTQSICHLTKNQPRNVANTSQHIPGDTADALSCFRWQEFRRLVPTAQLYLVQIVPQRPLSHASKTWWLHDILASAGISGNFSSHSFCIGAATVSARNGIPDHQIQALGR